MDWILVIGLLAGAITTFSGIPQVYKIYRYQRVEGLSLLYFFSVWVGVTLWFGYGIGINSIPVVFWNFTACVIYAAIVGAIISVRRATKKVDSQ